VILRILMTLLRASFALWINLQQKMLHGMAKKPDPSSSSAPWRVYNIGQQQPIELLDYIVALESHLGRKAQLNLLPLQPGDVPDTFADVEDLVSAVGYRPTTSVYEGTSRFIDWYRAYYKVDF